MNIIGIQGAFSTEAMFIFPKHEDFKLIEYPERYNQIVFEKFNEMNTDTVLQNNYTKWKYGVNYKTNRKIKIGGKIHTELKQQFIIYTCGGILFDTLNNINVKEYLQETEKNNKYNTLETVK